MSLNQYNMKLVKTINTKKMGTIKHIQFNKKDNKLITLEEVNNMYHKLMNGAGLSPDQIRIVGLNDEQFVTLKGYGDEEFADYWDDYLQNKPTAVQDKLNKFENIQFIVTKNDLKKLK